MATAATGLAGRAGRRRGPFVAALRQLLLVAEAYPT